MLTGKALTWPMAVCQGKHEHNQLLACSQTWEKTSHRICSQVSYSGCQLLNKDILTALACRDEANSLNTLIDFSIWLDILLCHSWQWGIQRTMFWTLHHVLCADTKTFKHASATPGPNPPTHPPQECFNFFLSYVALGPTSPWTLSP